MFREFLQSSEYLVWPLVAFVVFFLAFAGVLVVLLAGALRRSTFDHVASLPLEEEGRAGGRTS